MVGQTYFMNRWRQYHIRLVISFSLHWKMDFKWILVKVPTARPSELSSSSPGGLCPLDRILSCNNTQPCTTVGNVFGQAPWTLKTSLLYFQKSSSINCSRYKISTLSSLPTSPYFSNISHGPGCMILPHICIVFVLLFLTCSSHACAWFIFFWVLNSKQPINIHFKTELHSKPK